MTFHISTRTPSPHSSSYDLKQNVGDIYKMLKSRHKGTKSTGDASRTNSPSIDSSASFPRLRPSFSMSNLSSTSPPPIQKLSDMANATRQKAKDVWSRRRFNNTELVLMTTVDERAMDSPTIPGRPAIGQSKAGSLNSTNWRQNPFAEAIISSITAPPARENPLEAIAPLDVIQNANSPTPTFAKRVHCALNDENSNPDDTPPQVPPKDKERSKLQEKLLPAIPINTEKTPEREVVIPIIVEIQEGKTTTRTQPNTFHLQEVEKQDHFLNTASTSISQINQDLGKPPSEKQEDSSIKHGILKSDAPTTPPSRKIGPSEAGIRSQQSHVQGLQHFEILQYEQTGISTQNLLVEYTKELSQLEDRCRYLRQIQKSLREARKILHTGMLAHLRSSNSDVVSRDSLLKQEEAIAELDEAVCHWDHKVEKTEERCSQLRMKLLEGVAAITLPKYNPQLVEPTPATPPRTPDRRKEDNRALMKSPPLVNGKLDGMVFLK